MLRQAMVCSPPPSCSQIPLTSTRKHRPSAQQQRKQLRSKRRPRRQSTSRKGGGHMRQHRRTLSMTGGHCTHHLHILARWAGQTPRLDFTPAQGSWTPRKQDALQRRLSKRHLCQDRKSSLQGKLCARGELRAHLHHVRKNVPHQRP